MAEKMVGYSVVLMVKQMVVMTVEYVGDKMVASTACAMVDCLVDETVSRWISTGLT